MLLAGLKEATCLQYSFSNLFRHLRAFPKCRSGPLPWGRSGPRQIHSKMWGNWNRKWGGTHMWIWHLRTWFSGGFGCVRFMTGLGDLEGLFQPRWFCEVLWNILQIFLLKLCIESKKWVSLEDILPLSSLMLGSQHFTLAFGFLLGEFKTHSVFTEEGQKNQ